jgi:hypothetical protein
LSLVPHVAVLRLQLIEVGGGRPDEHKVLRNIAERLPNLRELVLRYDDGYDFDYSDLSAALASRGTLAALELRPHLPNEAAMASVAMSCRQWQSLLAQLPKVERLWLPRRCSGKATSYSARLGRSNCAMLGNIEPRSPGRSSRASSRTALARPCYPFPTRCSCPAKLRARRQSCRTPPKAVKRTLPNVPDIANTTVKYATVADVLGGK